jgi:hypothetical protein
MALLKLAFLFLWTFFQRLLMILYWSEVKIVFAYVSWPTSVFSAYFGNRRLSYLNRRAFEFSWLNFKQVIVKFWNSRRPGVCQSTRINLRFSFKIARESLTLKERFHLIFVGRLNYFIWLFNLSSLNHLLLKVCCWNFIWRQVHYLLIYN